MSKQPISERFWEKVDRRGPDECWEWKDSLGTTGYGQFCTYDGQRNHTLKAHRVAYELTNGQIPDGLCVLHRCDNRRCVNPFHLFLGTRGDNWNDMISKGRGTLGITFGDENPMRRIPGLAKQNAERLKQEGKLFGGDSKRPRKLSDEQVKTIRQRKASGERTCDLAREYGVHINTIDMIFRRVRRSNVS